MKILGICHDVLICSAAVVDDGRVVSAIAEERLDRRKQSRVFPTLAIERCLAESALRFEDLDEIVVAWNPSIELETLPAGWLGARRDRAEHLLQVPARLMAQAGAWASHELTIGWGVRGRAAADVRRPLRRARRQQLLHEPVRRRGRGRARRSRREADQPARTGPGRRDHDTAGGALPALDRALLRRGDAVPRVPSRFRRVEGDGARVVRGSRQRVPPRAVGSRESRARRDVRARARVLRVLQPVRPAHVLGQVRAGVRTTAPSRRGSAAPTTSVSRPRHSRCSSAR